MARMIEDFERCYRVAQAKDARFDGVFFGAVTSTGIYCRPSCPAITPKRKNIRFYPTAAAAQAAGFRACKRCRPDASPGSPEWNVRADVVARAMRLIADGVVDREGVSGLANRLHFSERHLNRLLLTEVGAGPQALARAHRAQTARVLIETTRLRFTEIAFAAGFASIRQFNDTIREVFASTPTELRAKRRNDEISTPGSISLRLPYRLPFYGLGLFDFLATRAIPGIEESDGVVLRRSLRLPRSSGVVTLEDRRDHIRVVLRLDDIRDLSAAVQRCRALLDLDADPIGIDKTLRRDPFLRPLVARAPGRRVPGTVDGHEMAIRAVIGQQISVAGARTMAARLVREFGKPLTAPDGAITHLFPEAEVLADADLQGLGFSTVRQSSIKRLSSALANSEIELDRGADREEARQKLLALPGVGPWTASYIAMRALGDPDAFPATDLGLRRALDGLGENGNPETIAERWRPWRAYALQHLWGTL
jgi:AraC family transcriptional regulator of adaptative response / DNA-3-methyladenine glycosylase II